MTDLAFPGAPQATATRPALPRFESIATVPEGGRPLEAAMALDPIALAFGVMHTDSNRHVNSLVYLRVFEEAALRRFVAVGLGSAMLARSVDIAYRKPCFAGQSVRVALQAFDADGRPGVAAVLLGDGAEGVTDENLASARPHAYVRMQFEP